MGFLGAGVQGGKVSGSGRGPALFPVQGEGGEVQGAGELNGGECY